MNKHAALAAIAALALSGCAGTPAPANIYEAVAQEWEGGNVPSNDWIDLAAREICMTASNNVQPVVVRDSEHNNDVVVNAAMGHVCEN